MSEITRTIPTYVRNYINHLDMVDIDSEADVRRVITKMGKDGVDMTSCPSGICRDYKGNIIHAIPDYVMEFAHAFGLSANLFNEDSVAQDMRFASPGSVTVRRDQLRQQPAIPEYVKEFMKSLKVDIDNEYDVRRALYHLKAKEILTRV